MISFNNIKETLGETSYCLRDICQSSYINKWSLFKPVTMDKRMPLTVDDFDSLNYGFSDYNYTTTFDKTSRNTLWNYSPVTSPYRLSDFKEYNHSQTFIDISNDGETIIATTGQIRCSFIGNIKYIFNHFEAFKGARTSSTPVYLCILLIGNTNYVYRESEIRLYDEDDIRFTVTGVAVGNYKVIPVLTNNTQVNNMSDGDLHVFQNQQGQYWLLPNYCEYDVTIQNQSSDYFDDVSFEFSRVGFEYDNYFLYNFTVYSEIINHGTRTYSISMNINYSNTTQGTITLGSHSCTLNPSSTDGKTISNNNIYETVTDAQLYDGIISVVISASITYGNTTQTKQWTTILEKD